ncbi:MAG: YicC family protein [Clostridia bacterium]|nr:YicC family protein [Clostridia bacterium]
MYSMTGYGKAVYSSGGLDITVEIKSVNNRFLDINCKYPRVFAAYEDAFRKAVQSKLARGRVDLFVTFSDNRERPVDLNVDLPLAKGYYQAARTLSDNIPGIENDFTVSSLMRMPEVVTQKSVESNEEFGKIAEGLVLEACDSLNEMRKEEGAKLKADILSHLDEIERIVGEIKQRAPFVQTEYRKKLLERITEYLGDVQVDEGRLLGEVAFFADKSNIDEEIARLYSHIAQFKKICDGALAGRKLDFLVQEFNREANTICSKANDVTLTTKGLDLKCEIEKIREQIQNLE